MKGLKFKKESENEADVLTKRTKGEKVLFGVVFLIFVVYSLVLVYPLLFLFINSFQDPLTYVMDRVLPGYNPFALPETWRYENYVDVFKLSVVGSAGKDIYLHQMLFNSVWYCAFTVLGSVMMCSCTGYVLSKYKFKASGIIYTLIVFSMTIPVVGTSGSTLKLAHQLSLYDTPWWVLLSSLTGWGFNFMVMYGFFKSVSWSYAEAVFLDGGSDLTVFIKVMLPQAKMAVITLVVVTFISTWNNYEASLLYFPSYPTLASGLYRLKLTATRSGDFPSYYAGLMVSVIPLIIVYASCSNIIFKNFSIGGLKG